MPAFTFEKVSQKKPADPQDVEGKKPRRLKVNGTALAIAFSTLVAIAIALSGLLYASALIFKRAVG